MQELQKLSKLITQNFMNINFDDGAFPVANTMILPL